MSRVPTSSALKRAGLVAKARGDSSSHGDPTCVLAVNAGSSSIRFALYDVTTPLLRRLRGKIERIGLPGATLTVDGDSTSARAQSRAIDARNHSGAASALIDWLEEAGLLSSVKAVGHRVVHGGSRYSVPALVNDALVQALRGISAYSPEHLPGEINLIERFRRRFRNVPQVACFDTAFHRQMPRVAQLLPIPRRFDKKGIRRFGFHGLSFTYLMEELGHLDPATTKGRVILAHLGNGSSLAAVSHRKSIDTSMGFTPTAGLVMSTRTGDLDPGLVYYLAHTERMTAAQFQKMVNHESGLLGVSEISSDLRDLLAQEAGDVRAAEAVALFCYQVKKWIGSFAAALGGLDTLVFAGGIGENSPLIRARICEGLRFLGIELNSKRNAKSATLISPDAGRVKVRVIRTDEELMIARSVTRVLNLDSIRKT
jgi:acetate kinase